MASLFTRLPEVFSGLYDNCPPGLWTAFEQELQAKTQEYLAKAKPLPLPPHSCTPQEADVLEDLRQGLPVSLVVKAHGLPRNKVEKLRDSYGVAKLPASYSNFYKSVVGGYTNKKATLLRQEQVRDEVLRGYEAGEGEEELAKRLKVPVNTVHTLLAAFRQKAPQEVRRETLELLESKDASIYLNLFETHEDWSVEDLVRHLQEDVFTGQGLSPKTVREYLKAIGCVSDKARRNRARKLKSSDATVNPAYKVKVDSIAAIEASHYGSVDRLAQLYCNSTEGTYAAIAERVNLEVGTDVLTARQVEKLVTASDNYSTKQSRSEAIFIEELKQAMELQESEIERQARRCIQQGQTRVDVYIPALAVAFEFNGDYWHSSEVVEYNYGITSEEFHGGKREACAKLGVRLLYVWETDFNTKHDEIIEALRQRNFDHELFAKLSNEKRRRKGYIPPRERMAKSLLEELGASYTKEGDVYACGNGIYLRAFSAKGGNRRVFMKYAKDGKELLTIFPWHDREKLKAFVAYRLEGSSVRVGARKCQVELAHELTAEDRRFMDCSHVLGMPPVKRLEAVVRLKHGGQLLGEMIFCAKDATSVELKRMAFAPGYVVPGGASKMLKAFERANDHFSKVFTFSDCDLSTGSVYERLGFALTQMSAEGTTWWHPTTKQKFSQKSLYQVGADRLLARHPGYEPVGIGAGLPSNAEIVASYGFRAIKDCGYRLWEKTLIPKVS